VTQGVWISDQTRVGGLQVGVPIAPLSKTIGDLALASIAPALAATVIGIRLAVRAARQITNPITGLTRTAKRMAGGDLNIRFRGESADEIGQLGRAFNDMATAIEKRDTDLRTLAHSLEQAVKQRTIELQQKNQYLEALHEVTLGLIEKLDGEPLLEAIITRRLPWPKRNAFVSIFDRERGELLRAARAGISDHLRTSTKPGQGLLASRETSQMMILEDYQEFEEKNPEFDWLRTSIYVPLRSGQTILGVIGLGYDKVVPAKRDHVDILNQFAQLASLAWVNAQLYSATREELTKKVQALMAEEERRKAYLASPQGQAELKAESILQHPAQGLVRLHGLLTAEDAMPPHLPQLKAAAPGTDGMRTVAETPRHQRSVGWS
jgi:HAMP domain-containing protein